MKYSKFQQLVEGGEKENADFKIRCEAFVSKKLGPKAELAKDVCAMANNGNVASYILVGVSDDGKDFRSVCNPKLTEENLQSFCKTAIFPPPKVKVYRERWAKASPAHAGKEFVVIQVGPHARQAFRLGRSFIFYPDRVCYRRNEVWIRRGSTTDLATPEEIARLVKGKAPIGEGKPEGNVAYGKLPRDEQEEAVLRDLQSWVEELGGSLHDHRVVIPLGKVRYVWRYLIRRECTEQSSVMMDVNWTWHYEHGILYLVIGTVSKQALFRWAKVHFKEKWGWFTFYDYLTFPKKVPSNSREFSLVTLTLPRLSDTDALRSSLSAMLQFLETDEGASERIREAREQVNYNLRRWLRGGLHFGFGRRRRHERPKELMAAARAILDLSAGRLP